MKAHLLKITTSFLLGYTAATLTGVLSILLWTRDLETIGLGLLVPLYTVPAILGYLVNSSSRFCKWRHVTYAIFMAPMSLYLLSVVLFPSPGVIADGADQIALACLIILLAGGITSWGVLEWFQLTFRLRGYRGRTKATYLDM